MGFEVAIASGGAAAAVPMTVRHRQTFGWRAMWAQADDAALWLPPLLEELREEGRSAHSWRRHLPASGPIDAAAAQRLLEAEQALRPTVTFTYVAEDESGRREIVAAATVAERVKAGFAFDGFPVLARCYIRPAWRGHGLYRVVLKHRYDYCLDRWGDRLRAIHLGTAEAAVCRVAATLDGVPAPFVHIGDEDLDVAGELHFVRDLLAFAPSYATALVDEADALGDGDAARDARALVADLVEHGLPRAGVCELADQVGALMRASGRHLNGSNPALRALFALADAIPVAR